MTMSDLQIRDSVPADGAAIECVTLAAYEEYAAQMPAHWQMYRDNIVATLADYAPAEQIVAERAGQIVGCVLLYPAGGEMQRRWPWVRLLAVDRSARGQGIGAALMNECIRRARRSGAPALSLHTTDLMHTAMRLYERMGFVRAPELDFSPAPGRVVKGYLLDLGEDGKQATGGTVM
jgi:predicted N-acetyltransferase YhbS